MTKNELIAKQQIEIEELKIANKHNSESFRTIHNMLYGCGAPLNDNCLNFNREQRDYLRLIVSHCNICTFLEECDCDRYNE